VVFAIGQVDFKLCFSDRSFALVVHRGGANRSSRNQGNLVLDMMPRNLTTQGDPTGNQK
jgi:hypothetical protein